MIAFFLFIAADCYGLLQGNQNLKVGKSWDWSVHLTDGGGNHIEKIPDEIVPGQSINHRWNFFVYKDTVYISKIDELRTYIYETGKPTGTISGEIIYGTEFGHFKITRKGLIFKGFEKKGKMLHQGPRHILSQFSIIAERDQLIVFDPRKNAIYAYDNQGLLVNEKQIPIKEEGLAVMKTVVGEFYHFVVYKPKQRKSIDLGSFDFEKKKFLKLGGHPILKTQDGVVITDDREECKTIRP